ncbi:hypothetical protein SUDANB1_00404 [Streptomyces sp. enrichment culture]|uniref:hypothetical protein n=1 Tax=Streptomyces sp. enrichment culture TaxID=1795815 RepID=UPI003F55A5AA
MNTKRVKAAGEVILAAQKRGHITASGWAAALESACMLQSPETAAELAAYRALELGTPEGRVSAKCEDPKHPVWLRELDDVRGCPWCRVAELEALKPAPIQKCRVCGAGYSYGEPCSTCDFKARMAAETASTSPDALTQTFAPVAALREDDPFHLHHTYRLGRDLPQPGGAP